jgi:hypothetical protein
MSRPLNASRARRAACTALAAGALLLAGCASAPPQSTGPPPPRPEDLRAEVVHLLPAGVHGAAGWATDIVSAFSALQLDPSPRHLCGVIAVTAQESSFVVDPPVPHLGQTAWEEIDQRAERAGIPTLLVHAALQLNSPDGRSYAARIDSARTEHDLSRTFDDFISIVPLGQRLFGGLNPVRTIGPMQVSLAFAEREQRVHPYPYPMEGRSLREELFTRRGGLYFGIAHLLAYPVHYDRMLYRFADFNAGQYASRNAAFQKALSIASGIPLVPDGALLRHDDEQGEAPSATELAARTLQGLLGLGEGDVHDALAEGDSPDFERSALYRGVYQRAEAIEGHALARAAVPQIELHGPKLTRTLTTAWYADRVEGRYRQCLAKEGQGR